MGSAVVAVLAVVAFLLARPGGPPERATPPAVESVAASTPATSAEPAVERLKVKVLAVHPHDTQAFTQGLLWHEGALYESTGLYGRSSLRKVALATGEVQRIERLPDDLFAEGLALAGDRLVQLTWQEGRALVWSLPGFQRVAEHRYRGEGWGLCSDGRRLIMSDGSDRLAFRAPLSFEETGSVRVTRDGRAVGNLNELECVDGAVWANVWGSDEILRIDPRTGKVTAVVDASGLLSPAERAATDVLNGIAWVPERRTFLITGKLWPELFEVVFEPAG